MVTKEVEKAKKPKAYISPRIEIIEMAVENGVMTGSGSAPGYADDGDMFGRTSSTHRGSSYSSSTASDEGYYTGSVLGYSMFTQIENCHNYGKVIGVVRL